MASASTHWISASASGLLVPTMSMSSWVNSRNRPGSGFSRRHTEPAW